MRNTFRKHLLLLGHAVLLAAVWSSCDVNSYPICVDDCTDTDGDGGGNVDAPLGDGGGGTGGDGGGGTGGDGGGGTGGDGGVIADAGIGPDGCPLGQFETCDTMDNDCDGRADEGPMQGVGIACGTNVGECVAGITVCTPEGAIECTGVVAASEICDGLDNDCDGVSDESIAASGSCGDTDVGECALGELQCIGGTFQCVGEVGPSLELCDAIDQDCDGNPLNGFDLNNDPQNCGTCGNVCSAENAISLCDGTGDCDIAICLPGFHDLNTAYVDGCEYGPCVFQSAQENCNQTDDDCDGLIDESLIPPDICLDIGACGEPAPVQPVCTAGGFRCPYSANVEVDANGNITEESRCDNIDNDCDGAVDEGHPLKGTECDDGSAGICRSVGTYACNAANPTAPLVCNITTPGQTPRAESCNNRDDDCDATVDEGQLESWVSIGNGVQIFAYEASRPDATTTDGGTAEARPCSKPDVLPWTNITRPEAEQACAAIGARLCSELEWQRACKRVAPPTGPAQQGPGPNFVAFVEAENFVANVSQGGKSWVVDNSIGYSGVAALRAMPNTGTIVNRPNNVTNSPRLDYEINFTQTGNHIVWILGWASNANDNTVHVGINGASPTSGERVGGFGDEWTWSQDREQSTAAAIVNVPSTGVHTINLWMREDGIRVDAILVTPNNSFVPNVSSPGGCEWSYSASCSTFQPTTCNGVEFDGEPGTPGNQDRLLPSGSLPLCHADWAAAGDVFDLSGNAREWTAPRTAGINPLRGGSFSSSADGISCDYNFTVANDSFFFPNVSFRCCREEP